MHYIYHFEFLNNTQDINLTEMHMFCRQIQGENGSGNTIHFQAATVKEYCEGSPSTFIPDQRSKVVKLILV